MSSAADCSHLWLDIARIAAETLPLLPPGIQVLGVFAAGSCAKEAAAVAAEGCPPVLSGNALVAAAQSGDEGTPELSFRWRQQVFH